MAGHLYPDRKDGAAESSPKENPKFQVSTEKGILGAQGWRYWVPQTLAPPG